MARRRLIKRHQASPRRDMFAELLSQDLTRAQIMEQMGLTEAGYRKHIRTIKAELGWQAQE